MDIDPWKGINIVTSRTRQASGTSSNNSPTTAYSNQSSPISSNLENHQQQQNFSNNNNYNNNIMNNTTNPNSNSHIPDHRRFFYHDVKETDTLAGLAILYGIEIVDLKQANNLLGDTDLSIKKNIRIPREKCRISHIHLINENQPNLVEQSENRLYAPQPPPLFPNMNSNSTNGTDNSNNNSQDKNQKTANELFAAIDMDMRQAMMNMKNVLEDSAVGSDGIEAASYFDPANMKSKSRSYRHSFHDITESEALIGGPSQHSSTRSSNDRHGLGHQSIFNYTTRDGMYIDDSSINLSDTSRDDRCSL